MKISYHFIFSLFTLLFTSHSFFSQTAGTFTFSFLPVTQTAGFAIPKNVLAIWIQTDDGTFVKTKYRFAGTVTSDHLPIWALNSGGPSSNCLSPSCNITDAITGATLPNFSAKTIVWDGKGVNGLINGSTVPDGNYKVTIQQSWGHLQNQTATYSYPFTKGPCIDFQTPANNAHITAVNLIWKPSLVDTCSGIFIPCPKSPEITYTCSTVAPNAINETKLSYPVISVYPNPTNGILTVNYSKSNALKVINAIGVTIYYEQLNDPFYGTKKIDLSQFSKGIYLIKVSNNYGSFYQKVLLDK